MPIRNAAEFVEALKAELREQGIEPTGITLEEPTADPSGMRTYSVMFGPRRPIKPANPQGETDE